MPRYALKIEYDGTPFKGWQRQNDLPTVQGAIETALRKLDQSVDSIAAAGRTDAGVHALWQVAHVDLEREWDGFRLSEAMNYHLKPLPVAILQAAPVSDDWHARFDATERRYLFRLLSRRAPLTHGKHQFWRINHSLNIEAMRAGAQYLIGRHDFTTFRSSICQAKSPVRTLDELSITSHDTASGIEYRFFLRARSFLHNQVRSFIGSLERVGANAWQADRIQEALEACDRRYCGPVCPAHGLYLAGVNYPEDPFQADTT